jgi:hypothetical protein
LYVFARVLADVVSFLFPVGLVCIFFCCDKIGQFIFINEE